MIAATPVSPTASIKEAVARAVAATRERDSLRVRERLLSMAYSLRPCFVCSSRACCRHREPAVELAMLRH